MKTLVFDIKGEYGHFKKPYSPMSPVTFPFPPPPAVMGILGAIMGISKNEYHEKLGWDKLKIGVRLLAPIQIFRSAINLLNTKDGTDKYLRPRANTNTHIQVNYEFLKSPAFRIYLAEMTSENYDLLKGLLKDKKTTYTPALGLAQCLAELTWVGEKSARNVSGSHVTVDSVIALNDGIIPKYEPGEKYQRTRIPAEMDSDRVVHRYQEILLAENAKSILCTIQPKTEVYQVGDETISFL